MFDSNLFMLLCLILSACFCCAPAMAINGFVDGLFDEEPPKRGGRKPSPRRGLPDDKSLHELARTYLERQHILWPELSHCGVLPPISDEAVNSLASSFKRHFLDKGWRPVSQGLATSHQLKLGAAYLRFSSDNSNPRSLNQQLVNCLDRARQDGVFVPWDCVCADAAVSGTIIQRRGYQMAKTLIASKLMLVEILYIDELGRAGRYAIEALRLGQLIDSLKKRLVGATDGFDTSTPYAKMMLHIFAMLHEWFVDQLREKVNRGMDDAFERGVDIAGAAFGYEMEVVVDAEGKPVLKQNGKPKRKRVKNDSEIPHVLEAFIAFAEEMKSPQSIGTDWNDRKVGGRQSWAPNTMTELLERETYAGFEYRNKTRQFRDPETGKHIVIKRPKSEWKRREVPHLQIVPLELWEKAQKRLAECRAAWANTHPNGGRSTPYPKTLVRPICWSCGKELVIGHSGQSPSFCCLNGRNHSNGCKFRGYKMASIVESAILDTVMDRILTPEFAQQLLTSANNKLAEIARLPKQDPKPIRAEIKKLQSRRAKLAAIIEEAGATSVKALVRRLQECERRLAARRNELKAVAAIGAAPLEPLQLAEIQTALNELRELLNADKAIAAPVLRMLTGPIVVEQLESENKKRPTWLAKFELNAVPVMVELTRIKQNPMARCLDLLTSFGWTLSIPVQIPLVRRTRYEQLGPKIKRQVEAGLSIDEAAEQHGLSKDLASRILEYALTGKRPDWHQHSLRPRHDVSPESKRPKYVLFAKLVAKLHEVDGIPLSRIPAVIKARYDQAISESTVTAAYKYAQTVAKYGGDLPDIPE